MMLEHSGRRRTFSMSSTRRTSSSSSSCILEFGRILSTNIGKLTRRVRPSRMSAVSARLIPKRNTERKMRGVMPMATPTTTTTTSLRHRERRARRFRRPTEIQDWVQLASVGLRKDTITGTRCTTAPSGSILPVAYLVLKSAMSTRRQSHLPLRNGRKFWMRRTLTQFALKQPRTPPNGAVRNSLIRRLMKTWHTSTCP